MTQPLSTNCWFCENQLLVSAAVRLQGGSRMFCRSCGKDLGRAIAAGHLTVQDAEMDPYQEVSATVAELIKPLTDPSDDNSLSSTRNP